MFWLGCGNFQFSTLNAAQPAYWAERWELYKHQYMAAQWAFTHGVRKLEFWCVVSANPGGIYFRTGKRQATEKEKSDVSLLG